jgi:ribosomal protein L40E
MIICKKCGHANEDDAEFCDSCREFLEWSGEKVDPAGDGSAQPIAVVAEQHVGEASGPVATLPGEEAAPPGPKPLPAPAEEPEPGQLLCDQCAAPNRAEARFCRRCGASLAGAVVVRRPPWWRRLLPQRRTYAAGERRRRRRAGGGAKATVGAVRGTWSRVMRIVVLVLILGGGAFAIGGWRGGLGDRVRDTYTSIRVALFPKYEPAIPVAMRSTSHVGNHTARRAFDKNLKTFWAEGAPGDGKDEKLVVHFGRELDVGRVGVTLGDQRAPQHFTDRPVPHVLRFRLFDRHGQRVTSATVVLAQKPDFQRAKVEGDNVTRGVMTIMSSYHAQKANHSAAVAEIEFFEKK